MKSLMMTTVFICASGIGIPVLASDIEDYAGLPLYEEDVIDSRVEVVNEDTHEGYEGLPLSRRSETEMQWVELEGQEGYDGLPRVESAAYRTWARQD